LKSGWGNRVTLSRGFSRNSASGGVSCPQLQILGPVEWTALSACSLEASVSGLVQQEDWVSSSFCGIRIGIPAAFTEAFSCAPPEQEQLPEQVQNKAGQSLSANEAVIIRLMRLISVMENSSEIVTII